jgi:hypothetical protein
MDCTTVGRDAAIAAPENVLRTKRLRLSLNHPSKLRNVSFPIVGPCLARKLAKKNYSAYDVKCPLCFAPIGRKCVGARGALRPIPHIPRELRAAETYRLRVCASGKRAETSASGTTQYAAMQGRT